MSYARDHLVPLTDEGLGNTAYLTGAVRLAADEGATVLAAAAGHRAFPHTALADGDETDLGGLTLRALATPGHTGEHLSYLLLDGSRELGVFTGGSLIVGSAARTSTIGAEKASNALLAAPDEDTFTRRLLASLRRLLASLGAYPAYFDRLAEVNRSGPAPVAGFPGLAPLTPAGPRSLMCGHGERAMTASSLLRRAGHQGLAVLAGGPRDWADATGQPLQEGA